jgi:hypothetical protein
MIGWTGCIPFVAAGAVQQFPLQVGTASQARSDWRHEERENRSKDAKGLGLHSVIAIEEC